MRHFRLLDWRMLHRNIEGGSPIGRLEAGTTISVVRSEITEPGTVSWKIIAGDVVGWMNTCVENLGLYFEELQDGP